MAVQGPFKVEFGELFPLGAYLLSVEAQRDWDAKYKIDDQARDAAGVRVWLAKIVDADPEAKQSEWKVKVSAEVQPDPLPTLPGTPFRPVEFVGMTVMPYLEESGSGDRKRARIAYSLRASGMREPGRGRVSGGKGQSAPANAPAA